MDLWVWLGIGAMVMILAYDIYSSEHRGDDDSQE